VSLISEALKRARLEAARREAADRGLRYPALPLHLPARRRRWPAMTAAVGLALAAGAAGGIFFLGARGTQVEGRGERAPRGPAGGDLAVPSAERQTRTRAPESRDGAAESPSATRPLVPRPQPGSGSLAAPPPAAETPESPAAPAAANRAAPVARPSSAPTGVPAAAPAHAADLPEYRRETTLAGGERIALAGIAWSEEHPVALLNGQPLGVGEVVHGLTVARIRPDGVELRGRGIALFLRLK